MCLLRDCQSVKLKDQPSAHLSDDDTAFVCVGLEEVSQLPNFPSPSLFLVAPRGFSTF